MVRSGDFHRVKCRETFGHGFLCDSENRNCVWIGRAYAEAVVFEGKRGEKTGFAEQSASCSDDRRQPFWKNTGFLVRFLRNFLQALSGRPAVRRIRTGSSGRVPGSGVISVLILVVDGGNH
jgi:hypothetical protein